VETCQKLIDNVSQHPPDRKSARPDAEETEIKEPIPDPRAAEREQRGFNFILESHRELVAGGRPGFGMHEPSVSHGDRRRHPPEIGESAARWAPNDLHITLQFLIERPDQPDWGLIGIASGATGCDPLPYLASRVGLTTSTKSRSGASSAPFFSS